MSSGRSGHSTGRGRGNLQGPPSGPKGRGRANGKARHHATAEPGPDNEVGPSSSSSSRPSQRSSHRNPGNGSTRTGVRRRTERSDTPSDDEEEDDTFASRYARLKRARSQERRDMIAQGKLAAPGEARNLADAIIMEGTCQEMCSEFERVERAVRNEVDEAEKSEGEVDESKMVKAFKRSAAGDEEPLPSDLRPPEVLQKTCNYLFNTVIPEASSLARVHGFIWNRTRAMRKEFTILQVSRTTELLMAVDCHERIARFHILSLHELATLKKPYPAYNYAQEREQLDKTLLTLMLLYDDHRDQLALPNEPEFRAYCILFELAAKPHPDVEDRVQTWPLDVISHGKVQTALKIYAAACNISDIKGPLNPYAAQMHAQQDWHRFFKIVGSKQVSFLMGCVAEIYFPHARYQTLNSIVRSSPKARSEGSNSNLIWQASEMMQLLALDDEEELLDFLAPHGLSVDRGDNRQSIVNIRNVAGTTLDDSVGRREPLKSNLVDRKRLDRNFSAIIQGLSVRQARNAGMLEEPSASEDAEDEDSLFLPASEPARSNGEKSGGPVLTKRANENATSSLTPAGTTPRSPFANIFAQATIERSAASNSAAGSGTGTATSRFGSASNPTGPQNPTSHGPFGGGMFGALSVNSSPQTSPSTSMFGTTARANSLASAEKAPKRNSPFDLSKKPSGTDSDVQLSTAASGSSAVNNAAVEAAPAVFTTLSAARNTSGAGDTDTRIEPPKSATTASAFANSQFGKSSALQNPWATKTPQIQTGSARLPDRQEQTTTDPKTADLNANHKSPQLNSRSQASANAQTTSLGTPASTTSPQGPQESTPSLQSPQTSSKPLSPPGQSANTFSVDEPKLRRLSSDTKPKKPSPLSNSFSASDANHNSHNHAKQGPSDKERADMYESLLTRLAEELAHDDRSGYIMQYVQWVAEQVIPSVQEKLTQERLDDEAQEFRTNCLQRRYGIRWRETYRRSRLMRQRKERRKRSERRLEQSMKDGEVVNGSVAGSDSTLELSTFAQRAARTQSRSRQEKADAAYQATFRNTETSRKTLVGLGNKRPAPPHDFENVRSTFQESGHKRVKSNEYDMSQARRSTSASESRSITGKKADAEFLCYTLHDNSNRGTTTRSPYFALKGKGINPDSVYLSRGTKRSRPDSENGDRAAPSGLSRDWSPSNSYRGQLDRGRDLDPVGPPPLKVARSHSSNAEDEDVLARLEKAREKMRQSQDFMRSTIQDHSPPNSIRALPSSRISRSKASPRASMTGPNSSTLDRDPDVPAYRLRESRFVPSETAVSRALQRAKEIRASRSPASSRPASRASHVAEDSPVPMRIQHDTRAQQSAAKDTRGSVVRTSGVPSLSHNLPTFVDNTPASVDNLDMGHGVPYANGTTSFNTPSGIVIGKQSQFLNGDSDPQHLISATSVHNSRLQTLDESFLTSLPVQEDVHHQTSLNAQTRNHKGLSVEEACEDGEQHNSFHSEAQPSEHRTSQFHGHMLDQTVSPEDLPHALSQSFGHPVQPDPSDTPITSLDPFVSDGTPHEGDDLFEESSALQSKRPEKDPYASGNPFAVLADDHEYHDEDDEDGSEIRDLSNSPYEHDQDDSFSAEESSADSLENGHHRRAHLKDLEEEESYEEDEMADEGDVAGVEGDDDFEDDYEGHDDEEGYSDDDDEEGYSNEDDADSYPGHSAEHAYPPRPAPNPALQAVGNTEDDAINLDSD